MGQFGILSAAGGHFLQDRHSAQRYNTRRGTGSGALRQEQCRVAKPLAGQGILWLIAVIPAILVLISIFIYRQYELTDEVIDMINHEIEAWSE